MSVLGAEVVVAGLAGAVELAELLFHRGGVAGGCHPGQLAGFLAEVRGQLAGVLAAVLEELWLGAGVVPALAVLGAGREEAAQAAVGNGGDGVGGLDHFVLVVAAIERGLDAAAVPGDDLE